MTTALTTANTNRAIQVSVNLDGLTAIKEMAKEIATSGVIGEITQSQGIVSLVAMREENLSIVQFRRKYQWVGNELSVRPNWMLGEFKRRGGKYKIIQSDMDACEIHFTTQDGDTYNVRITMDQMLKTDVPMKNGNLKKTWKNFTDDMLFARVCGKGLRRVAPELFCGVYTDGEATDMVDAKVSNACVMDKIEKLKTSKLIEDNIAKGQLAKRNENSGEIEVEIVDRDAPVAAAADENAADANHAEATVTTVAEANADPAADHAAEPESEAQVSAHSGSDYSNNAIIDIDCGEEGKLKCPVKGKYFGRSYEEIANSEPDIISALLTCNLSKHPELTEEHLSALKTIADKIVNSELVF